MIYRIKIVENGKFVRYADEQEIASGDIVLMPNGKVYGTIDVPVQKDDPLFGLMGYTQELKDISATHEVEWGCVHEGIELYENDIVTAEYYLFQDEGKYNYHGLINYDKESHCMALVYVCVAKDRRGISDGIGNMLSEYEGLILIGNANINPELLEAQMEDGKRRSRCLITLKDCLTQDL